MTDKSIIALTEFFEGDVRRVNHALKVYALARAIGEAEGLDPSAQGILEAAAILHDVGIKISEQKYNSAAGKYQELEGPPAAREILQNITQDAGVIDRVCWLIGHHHTYQASGDLDFQILIEADFLVNFYEESMTPDMIRSVSEKYFKTRTGKRFLKAMYYL